MNDQPRDTSADVEVRVRRAPRIGIFLIVGGLLGAIATFVFTSLFESDPEIGFGVLVGYFMIFGVPFGVAVGAIVGLLLDRRSRRSSQLALAERHHVDAPVAPSEASDAPVSDASDAATTGPETPDPDLATRNPAATPEPPESDAPRQA